MRKTILTIATVLALSGCGNRSMIEPRPGQSLPVAPYGREQPLTPAELLEPTVQAIPERSVELRRRSEERADDPFDLPPSEDDLSEADAATGVADPQ